MSTCPEDPRKLLGQPIGMYHCPYCGMMVIAGLEHPEPSEDNPDYDMIDQWAQAELEDDAVPDRIDRRDSPSSRIGWYCPECDNPDIFDQPICPKCVHSAMPIEVQW